ncbi:MAG: hypothetical protein RJQ09_18620 [Cyclobacteriaceae bacterium]
MKNPFRYSKRIVSLLLLTSIVTACEDDVESSKDLSITNYVYSGEDIFQAVFFADGKVVELIPDLKNNINLKDFLKTDEYLHEYRDIQNAIINHIKAEKPHFFSEFKSRMTSGDHVLILQTIQSTYPHIQDAILQIFDSDLNLDLIKKRDQLNEIISKDENLMALLEKESISIDELQQAFDNSDLRDVLLANNDDSTSGRSLCLVSFFGVFAVSAVVGATWTILFVWNYVAINSDVGCDICVRTLDDRMDLRTEMLIHAFAQNLDAIE